MKSRLINKIVLSFAMMGLLVGCSNSSINSNENIDSSVNYKIDVDLTILSSTMVYSEVYHMLTQPDDYIGKKVKMNGQFVVYANKEKTMYYPAVIIKDATACCAQGLEFVLKDDSVYPDDYPQIDSNITVIGTFNIYYEGSNMFCHLIDSIVV